MENLQVTGTYYSDPAVIMSRPLTFDGGIVHELITDDSTHTFIATVSVERYTPRLWRNHNLDTELINPAWELNARNELVSLIVSSLKSFDYRGN
mgnify:CR=1 FL=1